MRTCWFAFPLWLSPCRGRGLVCLHDLTSYAGGNFHVPGRGTQVGQAVSSEIRKEQLLLLFCCCRSPLSILPPFLASFLASHISMVSLSRYDLMWGAQGTFKIQSKQPLLYIFVKADTVCINHIILLYPLCNLLFLCEYRCQYIWKPSCFRRIFDRYYCMSLINDYDRSFNCLHRA